YTLANATDPDHRHYLPDSWNAEFRRLGTQQIGWETGQMNKPYGYQVLGGLLRYGNYDPRFLTPVAELHKSDAYYLRPSIPPKPPSITRWWTISPSMPTRRTT
ncbi:hypothetical protein VXC91_41610, partial [Streptomyces chiangmaiensis]|nr:hypothetical protein [Streptomyces chiangmaiensis]